MLRAKELRKMIAASGPKEVISSLRSGIEAYVSGDTANGIDPSEFNVREAFLGSVDDGWECLESWRREEALESDAVNTATFNAISRTFINGLVNSAYQSPAFVVGGTFAKSRSMNPGLEIQPEVANSADQSAVVGEGQEYPLIGMSENWVEKPVMTKRGNTILITKETITRDDTGAIQRQAGMLGEMLGMNRELRCIDVLIGYTNTYKRNGTASNTYQTSTPWINDQSNPIVDWSDIDESDQLFNDMTAPDTGYPIYLGSPAIIASKSKQSTFSRVLTATAIKTGADSGTTQTIGGNPVAGVSATYSHLLAYQIAQRGLASASNAKQWWFHGDPSRAFAIEEIYPLQMQAATAAALAALDFSRDIVAGYKASVKDRIFVTEPRYMVRNKN